MQHPNVIYRVVGLHCAHFCVAAKPTCHHGEVDEETKEGLAAGFLRCVHVFQYVYNGPGVVLSWSLKELCTGKGFT